MRRHLFVQETPTIDAVDGVSAQSSLLDELLDGVDQIEAFVLEVIRGGGGEHEQRRSRMTVRDEGHFHVQVGAVPGSCAAFHIDLSQGESGLEIFSQIFAERKFGRRLTVEYASAIKSASRPAHSGN